MDCYRDRQYTEVRITRRHAEILHEFTESVREGNIVGYDKEEMASLSALGEMLKLRLDCGEFEDHLFWDKQKVAYHEPQSYLASLVGGTWRG